MKLNQTKLKNSIQQKNAYKIIVAIKQKQIL